MEVHSSNSPVFDYRFIPFMSTILNVLLSNCPTNSNQVTHIEYLDDVLRSWQMVRSGDGNCCFSAVAYSLIANQKELLKQDPNFFFKMGIQDIENTSQHELSMKLREITVKEWQDNPQDYQGFLTNSTIMEESQLFQQSGHFDSALGDTVPLAVSNALGIPVIVFSSIQKYCVINITPRHLTTAVPILLAYLQHGVGHYDAAIPDASSAKACNKQPRQLQCMWKE